ncbi:sulfatase-like hydrolase/transferase [Echinicola vietnamensis]|uniref:Arylsulfatase A family protein n=1 Tax=Echinicola vietnamensis (strain DSM 17526 / LMG 23754 / KMM 6221) TaxID=926556 RepID=L0G477_ECHVK|nr:sulfatase-like hydrolase/transferase [Echinicola vietnamensis]AGA79630.1 arylsulfatase A family protein [Echinicola vietnamensis DSM 17526]
MYAKAKPKALLLFSLFISLWSSPAKAQSAKSPNIIFVLVDDLGYGDIGVFFQNERKSRNDRSEPWIMTPQLDKMAHGGAMLTDHYTAAPVCAPSRASILMGVNQGHAHVRDNQFDKEIGDNYTMGAVLKAAGYKTIAVGKWGLQGEEEGPDWPTHPLKVGFDEYFGYIRHRDGHEHYPVEGIYRGSTEVYHDYETVEGLDKCYTGDLFTAKAKDYIIKHRDKSPNQPFFMYLAYDTPHAVLELPTQEYPAGGGLNGGIQWLGKAGEMINTASGEVDSYVYPEFRHASYDHDRNSATPEVPWPDTYKRYASVNRRIDDQVGDLMKLLEDLDIDDNTLVVFTSDNGPSRESYLPKEFAPYTPEFFNNFAHFDGIKRDVYEGGLRTATIVHWPARIKGGTVISSPSISYDWMATFADAAGAFVPVRTDGVSLLPSLTGTGNQEPSSIYVEYAQGGSIPNYAEFLEAHQGRKRGQMQMIRQGDMVGVRYDIQGQDDDFEIYDVTKDPQQGVDLSDQRPALQAGFKTAALRHRISDPAAPRPYDESLVPSIEVGNPQEGLTVKTYAINSSWIPKLHEQPLTQKAVKSPSFREVPNRGNLVVWQGYVDVPTAGKYTFSADRGTSHFFMRIHDIGVLDGNFDLNSIPKGTVYLAKGMHPVKIYCMRQSEDASLKLFWAYGEDEKNEIPAKAWYR